MCKGGVCPGNTPWFRVSRSLGSLGSPPSVPLGPCSQRHQWLESHHRAGVRDSNRSGKVPILVWRGEGAERMKLAFSHQSLCLSHQVCPGLSTLLNPGFDSVHCPRLSRQNHPSPGFPGLVCGRHRVGSRPAENRGPSRGLIRTSETHRWFTARKDVIACRLMDYCFQLDPEFNSHRHLLNRVQIPLLVLSSGHLRAVGRYPG